MPKYVYDLKTGLALAGVVDLDSPINPDLQYLPDGVVTDRPLLVVEGLRDNSTPLNGGGSVAEGTGVLYVRSGEYASFTNLESYTGLVIKSSWGEWVSDGLTNDYGWSTLPNQNREYFMEAHYLGFRVARMKIVATVDYPYPM